MYQISKHKILSLRFGILESIEGDKPNVHVYTSVQIHGIK